MVARSPASISPTKTDAVPVDGPLKAGLHYQIAESAQDVCRAWGLVYNSYISSGLIHPNAQHLHTLPQAVGPQTAIVLGQIGPVLASTLSTYTDTPAGLPLDSVYPDELAALRDAGHRLSEVGLFADRRQQFSRSADSLFELMRYAFFYARHHDATDIIIGVHPRHAPFYCRLIGFVPAGPERSYQTVNDHPVVLLRLDLAVQSAGEARGRLPRGIRYFMDNPVGPEVYAQRFGFAANALVDTSLAQFLAHTMPAAV